MGSAFARIAGKRGSFSEIVIADFDREKAERAAHSATGKISGVQVDASDESSVADLIRAERCDAVLNAVDPRFVMPIFRACLAAGTTYVDMAMSLSHPHPEDPYALTGVKLGDEQFALSSAWDQRGLLALVGMARTRRASSCRRCAASWAILPLHRTIRRTLATSTTSGSSNT